MEYRNMFAHQKRLLLLAVNCAQRLRNQILGKSAYSYVCKTNSNQFKLNLHRQIMYSLLVFKFEKCQFIAIR